MRYHFFILILIFLLFRCSCLYFPHTTHPRLPTLAPFGSRWSLPSGVWCLLGSSCGCAACVACCVELRCGLKPTTSCVGSGSTWLGFCCRLMSNIACNWPWALCLGLPCSSLFVAVSTEPGCVCVGPNCVQGQLPPTLSWEQINKRPKAP